MELAPPDVRADARGVDLGYVAAEHGLRVIGIRTADVGAGVAVDGVLEDRAVDLDLDLADAVAIDGPAEDRE